MKKVLFWSMFIPIGLWMVFIGLLWGILDSVNEWTDRWTKDFECWCFGLTEEQRKHML